MKAIKINVNKQIDGYSFSLNPSMRDYIKKLFPNSHPANHIFVGYDTRSEFELFEGKLEDYIYPVLLGLENELDILDEIHFIETQTGKLLHKVMPGVEKV